LQVCGQQKLTPALGVFTKKVEHTLAPGLTSRSSCGITAVAVDKVGDVYLAGFTVSADFPLKGAWQITNKGNYDAFITKIGEARIFLR